MATARQILERAKAFNLLKEAADIVKQTDDVITDYVRAQLYTGKDKKGNMIYPQYKNDSPANKRYAIKKNRQNPIPGLGHPDLFLRGDLYKRLNVEVLDESVFFRSQVRHFKYVYSNYGEEKTFGLSEESMNEYRGKTLLPLLRKRLFFALTYEL